MGIGGSGSVDNADARLRILRLVVTLSADTEFAAALSRQSGAAIAAALTQLVSKGDADDLTTLYAVQLLGVLFDVVPEVAAVKSETNNGETEGVDEDEDQGDDSVEDNERGVVSALDIVLGARDFSDGSDISPKQVVVVSPNNAPW